MVSPSSAAPSRRSRGPAPRRRADARRTAPAAGDAVQRSHHLQRGRRHEGVADAVLFHQRKARDGSKRSNRWATTGTPAASAGSSTLSSPPAQAQSAGVHNRSPGAEGNSCGRSMPGRWPSKHAMAVQRALGRAGGAGGEDHQRRIGWARRRRVEAVRARASRSSQAARPARGRRRSSPRRGPAARSRSGSILAAPAAVVTTMRAPARFSRYSSASVPEQH
jgi:hypothetical protein